MESDVPPQLHTHTHIRTHSQVKYFLSLGLTVPPSALEVYAQAETFRRLAGNLDLIATL